METHMKVLSVKQKSEEWLEIRRKCISATDLAPIMGMSAYRSPLMLWEEKMGLRVRETNIAMERGSALEKKAIAWAEGILGCKLYDFTVQSEEYEWAIASLDGISEDGKILVEAKCPGEMVHQRHLSGKINQEYICQTQWQMFVTGCEQCHFESFYGEEGHIIVIPRDNDFIQKMILKASQFLHLLRVQIPPEPTDMDFMPRPDDKWHEAAQLWKMAKKRLKEMEEQEQTYRDILIDLSRGYNCKGAGLKTQKITKKGTIDYSSIEQLKNIDLEQYRKPVSTYWKLTEIE